MFAFFVKNKIRELRNSSNLCFLHGFNSGETWYEDGVVQLLLRVLDVAMPCDHDYPRPSRYLMLVVGLMRMHESRIPVPRPSSLRQS